MDLFPFSEYENLKGKHLFLLYWGSFFSRNEEKYVLVSPGAKETEASVLPIKGDDLGWGFNVSFPRTFPRSYQYPLYSILGRSVMLLKTNKDSDEKERLCGGSREYRALWGRYSMNSHQHFQTFCVDWGEGDLI